eukprot:1041405_1
MRSSSNRSKPVWMMLARSSDFSKKKKIRSDHRSLFLRLTIGQVNVRVWTQKDKERMKEEYNKFKWRTSFMFVLLPMFQLFVATNSTTQIIHTLYLMYYYSSLALRENVLRVNGSHIDAWWIFHHYISIGMSVVTVTMPNHLLGLYFRDGIFKFFLFQGGVMLLQNLYQSRRHYTRVATGKASPIDVAAGETLVETPREFLALIPLLFLTYLAELVVGGHFMFNTCTMNGQCHWQVAANGVLWTFMGVGNSLAVYRVLQKKARSKSVRHLHTNGTSEYCKRWGKFIKVKSA